MTPNALKPVLGVAILIVLLALISLPLRAQTLGGSLSGIVTDASGAIVPNAKVIIKSVATGQPTESKTNLAGFYSVANLSPGEYEVSVSAEGRGAKVAKVTLTAGAKQTLDLALVAPFSNAGGPSLSDLGFSPAQTQGNPQQQALLDRRSHMLKVHQRLGLITTGPLAATIITSLNAKGRRGTPGNPTGRNVHTALGAVTAGMYFTTAYFAIRAPKVAGTKTHGPIRVHKALAWVHGTGMVLTPILGAIAYSQLSNGQRVHGIAKAHSAVAVVTGAAYGAALLSVSVKF